MAILNDGKSDPISNTGDADKKFTKDEMASPMIFIMET
jgi:hypothetical protein